MHESAIQLVPHEHQAGGFVTASRHLRTVIYLRVSSARQAGRDYAPEGISIPAQRAACNRRAEQLGLKIVDEYVEPGRSATEMSKRAAFQRMLTRLRDTGDVNHVIVYKLSRMARNRVDDALVMADLREHGVTLISATESVDDSPVGQLMHGILATFNHIDRTNGRDIRTVIVDPERAHLIQLGFELFAAGNLTLDQLSERLYQNGLRTRPTARYPAQRVSISKLARMLRDRYYLGFITYRGEELLGRHDPIIDQHLFDRVQAVIHARFASGERRRVHHHYLKGTLYCGHCHQAGTTGRMIIQHTVTRRGDEYTYYQVNDDDQRRQLNRSLFRWLYLADGRITNHELRSATP